MAGSHYGRDRSSMNYTFGSHCLSIHLPRKEYKKLENLNKETPGGQETYSQHLFDVKAKGPNKLECYLTLCWKGLLF